MTSFQKQAKLLMNNKIIITYQLIQYNLYILINSGTVKLITENGTDNVYDINIYAYRFRNFY